MQWATIATGIAFSATLPPCNAFLAQSGKLFHPFPTPLTSLYLTSAGVPGSLALLDLGLVPMVILGVIGAGVLAVAAFYFGQTSARSHHAEEELERMRETFDARVRERTDETIKGSVAQRAGEERMARIIDSAKDAIITIDDGQRITMFNPAEEKMFGCPASDAVGSPLERFLPARFRTAHAGHIDTFGKNGVTRRSTGAMNTLSGLRTNGDEFPIEASISQVEVNGRKLFTAIVRDISETAQARELSSRVAAIVQSSEDAIISKTLDGIITSWNPAAERLFGFTAQEATGKQMLSFFPPHLREEEHEILNRIAKGEAIEHFESQRVRKDGELIDVATTISPLRDPAGRIVGASTIARDISERRRAEEEMRQQASLLDLAPVLVRDLQNRIVLWTHGAEQIYGFTKEEALERVSHELLRTEFPEPILEIEKSLKTQGTWEGN